jgi:arylsulfatase A-like enzyme
VIFFVIESLSASQVDGFGGHFGIMPNLGRFSAHSISMEQAYAHAPSSSVALSSILESSVPLTLEGKRASIERSLVDVAKRHGLRTSYFLSGTSYEDDLQLLRDLKFDTVKDGQQTQCVTKRSRSLEQAANPIDDRCALSALLDWIDSDKAPFLSVLWNNQTHYPYYANRLDRKFALPNTPSPWFRDSLTLYLNAAQETDAVLGELVRQLQLRGLFDETLIVVMGDHGEAFGQHGVGGHGTDVFEESIHIPLVMLYAGFSPRKRYADLFGLIDLAPSIAGLMGFDRPRSWLGIDIFSGERNRRLFYFANGQDALVGYRENNSKFTIRMPQPTLKDLFRRRAGDLHETFHRFDLNTDPGELRDLGVSNPEQRKHIKQRVAYWLASQNNAQSAVH